MSSIDKNLVKNAFLRAVKTYDENAFVQREMAEFLSSFISKELGIKRLNSILEIGCGTGLLTREIISAVSVANYDINDLSIEYLEIIKEKINFDFKFLLGD